jgi:hypothetical protein
VTLGRAPLGEVCRACRSSSVEPVVHLGDVPASDAFPLLSDDPATDRAYPLELRICRDCLLIQLGPGEAPPPEQPGPVESQTMLRHAAESADRVVAREGLPAGTTMIELHSAHGGSWGPDLQRLGLRPVSSGGQADLVVDVHFLMHEEDLDGVLAAHAARLPPDGVLVCEFFHALPMVTGNLIDTVRHGHFVYLTLLSATENLARHGLIVTWVHEVSLYGGSLQLAARTATSSPNVDPSVEELLSRERAAGLDDVEALKRFGTEGKVLASKVKAELSRRRAAGRRVAGYGAPSKAAVLLALADVDQRLLDYTVDLSPSKTGRRIPGTGVPIRAVEYLLRDRPDDVVLLTWDIADEVANQLARAAAGTGWDPTLVAPLPELRQRRLSGDSWRAPA